MSVRYNKQKHIKLLKYQQSLEKWGKSLSDYFKNMDFELLESSIMLVDYMHWKNKTEDLQLMKYFNDERTTGRNLKRNYFKYLTKSKKRPRDWKQTLKN